MTVVLVASGVGATATDVPTRYDVVIDGKGYLFLDTIEPSLPFRTHKATYTSSPTFVERQNIQGDYGDNQQDFYLTVAQRDWSLGEQLKFSRRDEERSRRYWQGTNVDVSTPGQVTIRQDTKTVTFAAAVRAVDLRGPAANADILAAGTTNLYEIDPAGAITDKGAHGLGVAPTRFGLTSDGNRVFLSSTAGGTVGVRKWTGSVYSTFSASGADAIEFNNNTLYGFRSSTADLVRWDTAGTLTSLFTWQGADGTARSGNFCRLKAYGGSVLALWSDGTDGPELWVYDGTGTKMLETLPPDFYASDMTVAFGTVFISGSHVKISNGSTGALITRPAIYYYAGGTPGLLWKATADMSTSASAIVTANHPSVTPFGSGLVFNDDTRGQLMYYDAATGGTQSIGTYTVAGDTPLLGGSQRSLLMTRNQTGAYLYPDTTTVASTATIQSGLIDYDSSLDKYFKGIKIDATIPSGSSVDIGYQANDVSGAYTSVVTGAAAGTEYLIGASARAVGYQITLNRGSSAAGPTLKRVYTRAAPILQSFKLREYVLNLSGTLGKSPIILRDGAPHPKTGSEMATDLIASAAKTSPITVIDRLGTFSGVIEPDGFELLETHPGSFAARVKVREV